MKPLTVIFEEAVTEPEGFFNITEYFPASAGEMESILRVQCPLWHEALMPFAFMSIGLLSFCQIASTCPDATFMAAVSSNALPASTVASFSGVNKTGVAAANGTK